MFLSDNIQYCLTSFEKVIGTTKLICEVNILLHDTKLNTMNCIYVCIQYYNIALCVSLFLATVIFIKTNVIYLHNR